LLKHIPSLAHIAIEVNPCQGEPCLSVNHIDDNYRHTSTRIIDS
jgi:hypothetical protein